MPDPIGMTRRKWVWTAGSLALVAVVLVGAAWVLSSVRSEDPLAGRRVLVNLRDGSAAQLSADAWRPGDVFACEGVGTSVIVSRELAGVRIEGYEVQYGRDGSLYIVCGDLPEPVVHE